MNEQATTTVYKLGRKIRNRSVQDGCLSYLKYLEDVDMAVTYPVGVPVTPRYPAFAYRSLEAVFSFKASFRGYGNEWVLWEAQAQGVQEPPDVVLKLAESTGEWSDMDQFWAEVADDTDTLDLESIYYTWPTPEGSVLCTTLTLTRLFSEEEMERLYEERYQKEEDASQ